MKDEKDLERYAERYTYSDLSEGMLKKAISKVSNEVFNSDPEYPDHWCTPCEGGGYITGSKKTGYIYHNEEMAIELYKAMEEELDKMMSTTIETFCPTKPMRVGDLAKLYPEDATVREVTNIHDTGNIVCKVEKTPKRVRKSKWLWWEDAG